MHGCGQFKSHINVCLASVLCTFCEQLLSGFRPTQTARVLRATTGSVSYCLQNTRNRGIVVTKIGVETRLQSAVSEVFLWEVEQDEFENDSIRGGHGDICTFDSKLQTRTAGNAIET